MSLSFCSLLQTITIIKQQQDVRGSVHHSIILKENYNEMQKCITILLFHIYMKLNTFRTTHRPSSEA